MEHSTSSIISVSLDERLQELSSFVKSAPQFSSQEAMNIAEDIAELVHEDLSDISTEIMHALYNDIYKSLIDENSQDDISFHIKERLNLVMRKLHLLLFGPSMSPILLLELLAKNVNDVPVSVRAQANTLIKILVSKPDDTVLIDTNDANLNMKAVWFYPPSINGIHLGGNKLLNETQSALQQSGFVVVNHVSPINNQIYYELKLLCNRGDLPLRRQFENPLIYEKEITKHLFDTMF